MYSSINSAALNGMEANLICVEVDISSGLPGIQMVGLLSGEVREAKERVQVALRNVGVIMRPSKITISLSPANLRKEGTGFDLPIAIGILMSSEIIKSEKELLHRLNKMIFIGELSLKGEVKGVKGILPIINYVKSKGIEICVVPKQNAKEASMIPNIRIKAVENMNQVIEYLKETNIANSEQILPDLIQTKIEKNYYEKEQVDFSQIKGQYMAKRGAEIAAAGFHNLLMWGPPGGGKSMIAKAIRGILPPLTWEESIEVSEIYSVAGYLNSEQPIILNRPFQSPHHTISNIALVGGGSKITPGVISLSHQGVLFLDEFPEFPRYILEAMRQPLEERKITIQRLYGSYVFPANFMFVGAMNPCKCGYYPDKNRCNCNENEIIRYQGKISGPLLNRIDLFLETSRIDIEQLDGVFVEETSEKIRERVFRAREIQRNRFQGMAYTFNGCMSGEDVNKFCKLGKNEKKLMETAYHNLKLTARSYHKVLKVARTIADLSGTEEIRRENLIEALGYRRSEGGRGYFG